MNAEEKHIHNLLKNIPIFWINLERSETRRKNKIEEFKKYNLNHTRIEAVDGNDIDFEKYKKIYSINKNMNKYELGCLLSHMKVIKHCYNQDLEYALVLEDDCTFEYFKYKKDTLLQLIEELKKLDGECIQLASVTNKKLFIKYKKIFQENKLFNCCSASAVAYLITKNGMKKILNNFENSKNLEVVEPMIYNITNSFLTPPYFSYPFLRNENGKKINLSTIRKNTKGTHATQTISKQLWNQYYNIN